MFEISIIFRNINDLRHRFKEYETSDQAGSFCFSKQCVQRLGFVGRKLTYLSHEIFFNLKHFKFVVSISIYVPLRYTMFVSHKTQLVLLFCCVQ